MVQLVIEGPIEFRGEIAVYGAKNAVSKLLTASMLSSDTCSFGNVPGIGDTTRNLRKGGVGRDLH